MNLVVMRPNDLIQLGELIGGGSEDVLLWIGKTVGKELSTEIQSRDSPKKERKKFETVLSSLTLMGFGKCVIKSLNEKKNCEIEVQNPISLAIRDRSEARAMENLYLGLFQGMFTEAGWQLAMDPETADDMARVTRSAVDTASSGQLSSIFRFDFEEGSA
jgi:hypothetical protein